MLRSLGRPPFVAPVATLLATGLLLTLTAACASSGGTGASNRKITLQVEFADEERQEVTVGEGEAATFDRADGLYRVTPRLNRDKLGEVRVEVQRISPLGDLMGTFSLREGDYQEMSMHLGAHWPRLWIRVLRVRPPVRRGPQSVGGTWVPEQ